MLGHTSLQPRATTASGKWHEDAVPLSREAVRLISAEDSVGSRAKRCRLWSRAPDRRSSHFPRFFAIANNQWSITINDDSFASYPLWYSEYQSPPQASFAGFGAFGGWKQPAMKQYAGA
jgi:hypothetical protein